jgi:hypothetical protein
MVSPNDHVVMNHQNQTRTNGIWGHVRYRVRSTWYCTRQTHSIGYQVPSCVNSEIPWCHTQLWLSSPIIISQVSPFFTIFFAWHREANQVPYNHASIFAFLLAWDHLLYILCKVQWEEHSIHTMTFIFSMLAYIPCILPWFILVFLAIGAKCMKLHINVIYQ